MDAGVKLELGPTLTAAREKLEVLFARLRVQRFWLQLAALTLLGLVTLGIVGQSAFSRAASFDDETARLQRIQSGLDYWAGNVVFPTPEETESWRESETFFQRLGSAEIQPLALANQLTRRGEEIGPGDIQIRLASPDSAFVPGPRTVGAYVVTSGQTALAVEMSGDLGSMISYLGALPPQLELAEMALSTTEGAATMNLLLLSREITRSGP